MVNFSFLGSRNAQLLKSQRIADQICKEIIGFIGSVILILTSMSGCYLMLRMVARRATESTTRVFPVAMMHQTTRQMGNKRLDNLEIQQDFRMHREPVRRTVLIFVL